MLEFIAGDFPVRGLRFPDVGKADQAWFLNRPFHCLEVELTDEALLREVYDRLAYGGTPHDPAGRLRDAAAALGCAPSTAMLRERKAIAWMRARLAGHFNAADTLADLCVSN